LVSCLSRQPVPCPRFETSPSVTPYLGVFALGVGR
jgi:hypothetical protein